MFPRVGTWLEIRSGQCFMPSDRSELQCCKKQIIYVQEFCKCCQWSASQPERSYKGTALRYNDGHIHQDWVGDLRTSCFPLVVQHKHKVEWQ